MKSLLRAVRTLSIPDIKAVILLFFAFIPGKLLGVVRNIWLFIDRPESADDNSWVLFKWTRKNHPDRDAYFVLDSHSFNFDRTDRHFIRYGSFRHYVYYIASNLFLDSTFATPRPNARVCFYFEKVFKRHLKKVYLRHGVHKDGIEMHTYAEHRFDLFICGAKPEYDFFLTAGDYPNGVLCYTGLARFDDLLLNSVSGRFILVMPTWRRYIGCDSQKNHLENESDFLSSTYFKHYCSLLNNKDLISFLKRNGLTLRFCLHNLYRKFSHLFRPCSDCIQIMTEHDSIHSLLTEMGMLITDYSSVFFDAAYTGKPLIYYHFDYDEFRSRHFSKGYFDYEDDGFGPVVRDESSLIESIMSCYNGESFERDPRYQARCNRFFPLHDTNNCSRIYQKVESLNG